MIDRTSAANIQSMLETIRAYQAQATGAGTRADEAQATKTQLPNFSDSVKNILEKVNDVQTQSTNLQEAYQRGEDVPLTDVVLGMQKASLAFEATLQVRNKVLKAYEEILNMPV
jgi:flagellar hook-basal body complex protein FliE